ncbi:MAG: class I SAM-dependent methyltransferase, partial [Methylococcales bacterium]|nr:class I SAM-dependent methyltransferase [Methylococcales bacterium]
MLTALHECTQLKRVVLRLSRTVQTQKKALFGLQDGMVLVGEPLQNNVVQFQENGLVFVADLIDGQKTGFFLDQRDNRARVEKLASGRTVLNVFAYTGGFSLYAARGGATRVVSLDLSRPALETAVQNFQLNLTNRSVAAARHEQLVGDAFQKLEALHEQGQRFEMVIIDP